MEERLIRSPFFYVGDKFKLLPQLLAVFPDKIRNFYEPFCGGGSVFLNVQAERFYLNDLNHHMIRLHQFLFDYQNRETDFFDELIGLIRTYRLSASFIGQYVPEELKAAYPKTYYAQYNRPAYQKMREDFNKDRQNQMCLYLLLIYGFNRMLRFNKAGAYNIPVGNVDFNRNAEQALKNYFKAARRKNAQFSSMDYEAFLKIHMPRQNDFVYLDPPYLITNSEYNKGWDLKQEERMLTVLDQLNFKKVPFAVSNVICHKGRKNEMFMDWMRRYRCIPVKSNYISYHNNSGSGSSEVLVTNIGKSFQ